jgi:hypothetical protein
LRTLEESGLDYCLLKGSATGHLLYAQPHMRGAWDLDLGVPASALGQAEAIANACGYVAAQQDAGTGQFHLADPRLKAKVESEHYELGFLVRRLQVTNLSPETREAIRTEPFARKYWFDVEGDAPYCYASVDIHHAISHDIPLVDLLGKSREISYDDFKVRVPSETWLLFHLVFKIYWEGVHNYRKGLYEYADLIRLMRNIDPSTIGELSEILERHNLLAAGYYVLRRLPHFGYSPGPEVLGFLARTADPGDADDAIRLNDLGDMWPKMWGRR